MKTLSGQRQMRRVWGTMIYSPPLPPSFPANRLPVSVSSVYYDHSWERYSIQGLLLLILVYGSAAGVDTRIAFTKW